METTPDVTQASAATAHPLVLEATEPAAIVARPPQALASIQAPASDLDRMVAFESRKKSMAMAYLLWWISGSFGGHRFYLGRTGSATAMLCITLTSLVLMFVLIGFFTIFISAVWALVDAFQIPGWVREHNAEVARSLAPAA